MKIMLLHLLKISKLLQDGYNLQMLGLFMLALKNAEVILQFQSFTFAEASQILCWKLQQLPQQPQQINLKYFHCKCF